MDHDYYEDTLLGDLVPSQDPLGFDWDYDTDDEMLHDMSPEHHISLQGSDDQEQTHVGNSSQPNYSAGIVRDRDWIIAQIETMLEGLVDGLLAGSDRLVIILKSRSGLSRRNVDSIEDGPTVPSPRSKEICWPGRNAQEAWRFTVILRILELIHQCLIDDVVMTKRDIYYRNPNLFVKQTHVDRYIDELACTFGVSRSQLNAAAVKGLVSGNFTIQRKDGSSLHGLTEKDGILIPFVGHTDTLDLSRIRWILVIEKQATFYSLLGSSRWERLGSQCILLTAKGYPDLASRKFLRRLADHCPHTPMYAFVDFDPDGIGVMSTYKHGSYRLAHEDIAAHGAHATNLPDLHWLGVQSSHFSQLMTAAGQTDADAQGVMNLTCRDRSKAVRMLEWDICAEDGAEPEWRREIQIMLMLNIKVEMQILEELPGGLTSWLDKELSEMHGKENMEGSDDEMLFDLPLV